MRKLCLLLLVVMLTACTPAITPAPTKALAPTDAPAPAATAGQAAASATATLEPTQTAAPSATPAPTDTPAPTPTATPEPLPLLVRPGVYRFNPRLQPQLDTGRARCNAQVFEWCVWKVWVRSDGAMVFYTGYRSPEYLKIIRQGSESSLSGYITDDLGNEYPIQAVGGSAADLELTVEPKGQTSGWWIFEAAAPGASVFTAYNRDVTTDNTKLEVGNIALTFPDEIELGLQSSPDLALFYTARFWRPETKDGSWLLRNMLMPSCTVRELADGVPTGALQQEDMKVLGYTGLELDTFRMDQYAAKTETGLTIRELRVKSALRYDALESELPVQPLFQASMLQADYGSCTTFVSELLTTLHFTESAVPVAAPQPLSIPAAANALTPGVYGVSGADACVLLTSPSWYAGALLPNWCQDRMEVRWDGSLVFYSYYLTDQQWVTTPPEQSLLTFSVVDNLGNQYPVRYVHGIVGGSYSLERNVPSYVWLSIGQPQPGATSFTWSSGARVSLPPFDFSRPEKVELYLAATPPIALYYSPADWQATQDESGATTLEHQSIPGCRFFERPDGQPLGKLKNASLAIGNTSIQPPLLLTAELYSRQEADGEHREFRVVQAVPTAGSVERWFIPPGRPLFELVLPAEGADDCQSAAFGVLERLHDVQIAP